MQISFEKRCLGCLHSYGDENRVEIHVYEFACLAPDAPGVASSAADLPGSTGLVDSREAWPCPTGLNARPLVASLATSTVAAMCLKGSEDLNAWMIANGWAVALRRYSQTNVADKDAGRRSGVNIWSGEFHMRWNWGAQRLR